ncbi:MAG TPA: hypothetical protein VJN18_14820 [Polyangiaceae bacterium]|nr:hypothetical protein [Polyangiaceae bacterium]
MTEYGKLTGNQRAALKRSDPARFTRLRAEHQRAEQAIEARLGQVKTHDNYKAVHAELVAFREADLAALGGRPAPAAESAEERAMRAHQAGPSTRTHGSQEAALFEIY